MNDNIEHKKAKGTKKYEIKRELMFKNYKDCQSNDEIILKSQQRFKRDHRCVYTEQINKTALSSNVDKGLQTFDKITTYPSGTNAFKVCESEMLCKTQNIDFDDYANQNKTEYNLKWSYIPDHPQRILIIGGSGPGKTNGLLNLINNQSDIDKLYLCAKDPHKAKYQFLINKRENTGLKHFNGPKAFIEYSNDIQDIYKKNR